MSTHGFRRGFSALIAIFAGAMNAGCETATPVTPPTFDQRFEGVRSNIQSLVDNHELNSVAIGVIESGRIVWAESFGYADQEAREPATINTPYGVASMGKAITATAAMTLVEAGKLDLDADVAGVLGDGAVRISAGDRAPTVRELLNMTSGAPHGAITYFGEAPDKEEAILDRQSVIAFPPGSTFHYSNFSMAIMERVIRAASGQSFDDYVRSSVFQPLAMKDAMIGADPAGAAARYRADGTRFGPLTPFPRSSRQMHASLSDILQFAFMNLKTPPAAGRSPLTEASIDRMHNEKSALAGAHIALGFGNFDLGGGERLIASSGNDMGVQSSMFLLPETKTGAIVLANSSGYQTDELAVVALDAVAPGTLAKFLAVAGAFEARTTPFAPAPPWLGDWSGRVDDAARGIPVELSISNAGVQISFNGAPKVRLEEASVRDGVLTGAITGELPLFEQPEGPHRIEVTLTVVGDQLYGFALANFRTIRGKFEIPTPMALSRSD